MTTLKDFYSTQFDGDNFGRALEVTKYGIHKIK
jgi:hypothetical protein